MGTPVLLNGSYCKQLHRGLLRRGHTIVVHARKQAKKGRKAPDRQPASEPEVTTPRIVLENLDQDLPQAPSPGTRPSRLQEASPGEIYPVFAPKPGAAAANAPWRWDDDDGAGDGASSTSDAPSDVPRWNPRTGFMRTAAELQAEAAAMRADSSAAGTTGAVAAVAAAAEGRGGAEASTTGLAGRGLSSAGSSNPRQASSAPADVEVSLTVPAPAPAPSSSIPPGSPTAAAGPPPLMPASRKAVLTSALGTGFWMAVLAVFVRNYAALNSAAAMGTDPAAVEALLRWPSGFESLPDVAAAVGAAALVTGARQALLSVWADLRDATDRSNTQVLTSLGQVDILLVALASGVPEELLFRGALVPATFPDWRGVLVAAAIFGVLHNSGGRNPAFALWASAVGAVYGAVFVATGNVWVPAAAHVAANAASAFLWKARMDAKRR